MAAMENKETLTEAVLRARLARGEFCTMCDVGDKPIDGLHRGKYKCGLGEHSMEVEALKQRGYNPEQIKHMAELKVGGLTEGQDLARQWLKSMRRDPKIGLHIQSWKPASLAIVCEAYASSLRDERDQARDLAIKVEGRYQDVLKELADLRGKIEMLTTPDPDLDGERGFYEDL